MFHGISPNLLKSSFTQRLYCLNSLASDPYISDIFSKYKKALLVTGKNSYISSGAQEFIFNNTSDIKINIFNEFDANPDIDQILNGHELANQTSPDAIIAVGGGSTIDVAKIIYRMYVNNIKNLDILDSEKKNFGYKKIPKVDLIAIPTTAGTGSEATHFAVAYRNSKKYSIASIEMLPKIAILNSRLCLSNSEYQNACSGFDAFSQAIESYWSKNSSFLSRYYARKAIEIILGNFIDPSMFCGVNKDVYFKKMLLAANFSGKAINISKTTAPHALSYGITKELNLPHGHAVAITLGAFFTFHKMKYNEAHTNNRYRLRLSNKISNLITRKTNMDPSDFLYGLMESKNMEYDLERINLNSNLQKLITRNVNLERIMNHPVELSSEDIEKVFKLIPTKS